METTLRAYDRTGTRLGDLPWSSLTRTVVRNAAGALTAQVPRSLLDQSLLTHPELYLRVAENGVEAPDWYLLNDDGDDDANDGGAARPVDIGADGVAAILEWGTVYSWEYDPAKYATNLLGLDPTYKWTTSTPGLILKTFIDKAQARGCFPQLTYSFTAATDSAGVPWPRTYSKTYAIGITIGKVLTDMATDGWVDWEMAGFRLDVYVSAEAATSVTPPVPAALAADYPDVVLRLGQGVTQAPRKRTRIDNRSVLLANGNEGVMVEVVDPAAVARLGRREGYSGRDTITDVGTLVAASQVELSQKTSSTEAFTLAVVAAEAPALPRPGGYIRYDQRRLNAGQLEPMRVQSIAWDYAIPAKVSVELNDLWLDRDVRLSRQVDALLNGSGSNERVPITPAGDDHVAPSAPTGLALTPGVYMDQSGHLAGSMTARWQPVLTDEDKTAIDDLRNYELQYIQPEVDDWTYSIATPNVVVEWSWSPVVPNTLIKVRVRAMDRYGNPSDWSPWVQIMTGTDTEGPPTPSAPQLANYLGLLRIGWDGTFADAAGRPADFSKLEVHISQVKDFPVPDTPVPFRDGGTLAGSMFAAGAVYADVPYDKPYYAKLVGVDITGNRSGISAQAGPVATTKADSLDIGEVNVGLLSGGKVTVDIVLGGKIATGERLLGKPVVEMNALGLYRWDANDKLTMAVDDLGVLLVGEWKTALSGRRIEMGSVGREGRIDFLSAAGDNGFIRAWTESGTGSIESIQIGMIPSARGWTRDNDKNILWNRLNINSSPNGDYTTLKSGALEFTYDAYGVNATEGAFSVWQTGGERGLTGSATRRLFSNKTEVKAITGGNYATVRSDVVEFSTGGTKVTLSDGQIMQWFSDGSSVAVVDGTTGSSARLIMMNTAGFGGLLKFYYDPAKYNGADTGTWPQLQARANGDDVWIRMQALGFDVPSDAGGKTEIQPVSRSLLAQVRGTRVRSYKRTDRTRMVSARADVADQVIEAPTEIGLIAQEAPAQIQVGTAEDGLGIDLYQMASMTWGALAELAQQVDDLKKGARK